MTVDAAAALRKNFQGRLVTPGDDQYDQARAVASGKIDKRPAVIAYATRVDDVRTVVAFARDNDIELAVRGGGHSFAGHSVCEGGVVLDISSMKNVEIDLENRTAWTETGATAAEFTNVVGEHGLAVGFGDMGTVGIGGLTLSGGVGFLSRKYGLTIDSLLAADLVTADGQVLRVDAEHHPDLFWAIRGGGGNFGVATRLQFRLAPVNTIIGGILMLPATADTVSGWMTESAAAPDELTTIANVVTAPPMPFVPEEWHNKLIVMGMLCFCGPAEQSEKALAPFRALATPIVDMVREIPYREIYVPAFDDRRPITADAGLYTDAIDTSVAEAIVDRLENYDAMMRMVQLRALGGAIARVPDDATAYAHRSRPIMAHIAAICSSVEEAAERKTWVDDFVTLIRQDSDVAAYVGFVGDLGEAGVRSAYPPATYARLAAVKAQYDPTNLFRLNHNIPPVEG